MAYLDEIIQRELSDVKKTSEIKCTNTSLCVCYDENEVGNCSAYDSSDIASCPCRIEAEKNKRENTRIKEKIHELEIIANKFIYIIYFANNINKSIKSSLCENCGNEINGYPCGKCGFNDKSIE